MTNDESRSERRENDGESSRRRRIESARKRAEGLGDEAGGVQGSGSLPLRGQQLGGRYTLERRVGRGGMGVVWLARDHALDEPVALKFLPKEIAADPVAIRELREEARVMRNLAHPNIVRLHDIRFAKGRAFLVQEYMAGGSLADHLEQSLDGCLSVEEVLWALREIVPALAYAHAQGITHRDIKPANLLISKTPRELLGGVGESLRVADFGLAFMAQEAMSRSSGYRPSGTLAYMAPEILLGKRPTPAADVYSLGATLFCMIDGAPPFGEGDVATQILHTEAPPLHSGRSSLDHAVAAALAKDPADRPASAEEFLRIADGSIRLESARVQPRPARAALWGVGAATVVLVAAGLSIKLLGTGSTEAAPPSPSEAAELAKTSADPEPGSGLEPGSDTGASGAVEESPERNATVESPRASAKPKREPAAMPTPRPSEVARGADSLAEGARRAPSLDELAAVLGKSRGVLLGGACDTLCEQALARAGELVSSPAEGLDLAQSLVRLEDLERAGAARACGHAGRWHGVAAGLLAPLAEALTPDAEASSRQRLEAAGAALNLLTRHAEASHPCLASVPLGSLREASEEEQRTLLAASLAQEGLGCLDLLAVLRSGEEPMPALFLDDLRARLAALTPAGVWEADRRSFELLGVHLAIDADSPVATEAHAARARLLAGLVDQAVDEEAPPVVEELFARLALLDEVLAESHLADSEPVRGIAPRIITRFNGRQRSIDLLGASYRYVAEHEESALRDVLDVVVGEAGDELFDRYGLDARSRPKQLGACVELVTELHAQESRATAGDDGAEPALSSTAARFVPGVRELIAKIVEDAREKVDSKRAGERQQAYTLLENAARAIQDAPLFAEEFDELLPQLVSAYHRFAMSSNEKWRKLNVERHIHSTREFEDAANWAGSWLRRADTPEAQIQATEALVRLHLDNVSHYAMLCDRIYQPRGLPHQDAEVYAPWNRASQGLRLLEEVIRLLSDLEQIPGASNSQIAGLYSKARDLWGDIQRTIQPVERTGWPGR